MNILVVDDLNENRYYLKMMLQGNGYTVDTANNGKEALEKLETDKYDMIISDILMPEMDGYQLCRNVKSNKKLKNIIFIFYTATYTNEKDEAFALDLGADKFIVKPMDPDVFLRTIKDIISDTRSGEIKPKKIILKKDADVFKVYSQRLVNKLEDKMLALEKTAKKYQKIFDNANDAIYLFEIIREKKASNFYEVNNPACEMLGYTKAEFKGLSPDDIEYSGSENKIESILTRILVEGQVMYIQKHITKQGEQKPVEINAHLFELEGKKFVLAIARDITERLRKEDAIRQAEESWRKSFNSLMEIMIIINKDLVIENINQTGLDELRKCRNEVIGAKFDQIFPDLSNPINDNPIQKTFTTQKTNKVEYYDHYLDKYFAVKCSPVNDKDKFLDQIVVLLENITERKKTERKLIEYQENLEKIIEERTQNLEKKNKDLQHYIKLFENREYRIKELRDEVNTLKMKLGKNKEIK